MQKEIIRIAKLLNITTSQAEKVVNDDKIIDSGGRCAWEMDVATEKKIKKEFGPRGERIK